MTILISLFTTFFFIKETYAKIYDNTAILPDNSSFVSLANLSEPADDETGNKDVRHSFIYADGVIKDNRYPTAGVFAMCGMQEKTRLYFLLDYECRAP